MAKVQDHHSHFLAMRKISVLAFVILIINVHCQAHQITHSFLCHYDPGFDAGDLFPVVQSFPAEIIRVLGEDIKIF